MFLHRGNYRGEQTSPGKLHDHQTKSSGSKGTKSKPVELKLRERDTKKVHIYKGWTEVVAAPKNKPKQMPAKINSRM